MKLQVSVDLLSLEQAMNLLKEVAPYVDIIEAGTPLIKQEGLKVLSTFKEHSFCSSSILLTYITNYHKVLSSISIKQVLL